jgi:hypothetical protein
MAKFYVLDAEHKPHGIVVHATSDEKEARSVAVAYEATCGRPTAIAVERPWKRGVTVVSVPESESDDAA